MRLEKEWPSHWDLFVVRRGRLRCRSHCILHGLLLQRHHRMGDLLLLRLLHDTAAVDHLQQPVEHAGLLRWSAAWRQRHQDRSDDYRVSRFPVRRRNSDADSQRHCQRHRRRSVTGSGVFRVRTPNAKLFVLLLLAVVGRGCYRLRNDLNWGVNSTHSALGIKPMCTRVCDEHSLSSFF